MIKTKKSNITKGLGTKQRLEVLSTMVSRLSLSQRLGKSFSGDRDLYSTLGYPTEIEYEDYRARYSRQGIAAAIIDRPIDMTWTGKIEVKEIDNDTLQKDYDILDKELKLKNNFKRLDTLSSIGRFAVLLLGFNDIQTKEQMAQMVTKGTGRKLLYVKSFSESMVKIKKYDNLSSSKRYGKPVLYQISMDNISAGTSFNVDVHYTRVIHVAGEVLENDIFGIPVMQKVYNRLMDLEKLVGGSAEMFWRGARPGITGNVAKDFEMGDNLEESVKLQIDEFEHDLRRILVNQGVEFKTLDSQISDPINHVDIQIQMISAETGIPKRILTGSERGELASSEDKGAWLELIQTRREEYAEANIVRTFIDRCIEFGVLSEVKDGAYLITWSDLFAQSEKEKTEIGKVRSMALKDYTMNPMAQDTIPAEMFLKHFLGFTEEQIEEIEEIRETQVLYEGVITDEEEEIIKKEAE